MISLPTPLPWYVAGPLIGLVVPFVYWYGGKKWGVSSNLRHLCAAIAPSGIEYFQYDWRRRGAWHLTMATGMVIGGAVAGVLFVGADSGIAISEATRADLGELGLTDFRGLLPAEVFNWRTLGTLPGLAVIVLGGFLVGFGARYADGCTSGHAISGLSTLQRSSLVAVVGFFAGGLISTYALLPFLLS
jgi:hypothetical protein